MAIKKGICKNYGECSMADTRPPVIQEADSTNFVCKECGSKLYESGSTQKSSPWKKIALGVAGAAVLGGGGYFLLRGNSNTTDSDSGELSTALVKGVTLSRTSNELTEGSCDTLHATVSPEGCDVTLRWASSNSSIVKVSDGIVTAVSPGTAKIGVQIVENPELKAICEYTVTVKDKIAEKAVDKTAKISSTGELDLGYGIYTGPTKNGKPHGNGRLVYKRRTIINSTDIKQREAQSGESIQGQFVNGTFTIGKHYDVNGHLIESLNFGVAN